MNELVKIALAGTAKTPTTTLATETVWNDGWDTLGVEREWELLLRAGTDAAVRLAGYVAQSGVPLPQAAEHEHLPMCSDTAAHMIMQHLSPPGHAILLEALTLLAHNRKRLPPAVLPKVLDVKEPLCRKALRPVLGERGYWLSQFNPAWHWVTHTVDSQLPANAVEIWEQATPEERLNVLRLCRTERPAEARDWLEQVWRAEKADFRSEAIALFRTGLSLDDQPLLERALDDRSQNVRARAATLLASLDDSALAQRMRARAEGMIQYEAPRTSGRLQKFMRSLTSSAAKGTFTVTLPETLEKSWQRDNISAEPVTGLGSYTSWFTQVIAYVAPSHWNARWEVGPMELVAAAVADQEHGLAILKGWSHAAILHHDVDWALPLWNAWANLRIKDRFYEQHHIRLLEELIEVLPEEQADALALEQFARVATPDDVRSALIRALPAPWSPAFGSLFLEFVFPRVSGNEAYKWHNMLSIASNALPHQVFGQTFQRFASPLDKPEAIFITSFLNTLETRQRLYEEISR